MKNVTLFTRLCALLLLASCLFACGGEKRPSPATAGSTVTTQASTVPTTAAWEAFDGGGETLLLNYNDRGEPYSTADYLWGPDQIGSDTVMNLIYNRNEQVFARLNLQPEYQPCSTSGSGNILNHVQAQVMASRAPDLFYNQTYGMYKCIFQGYFANALDTEEENYIDLTADGWYSGYMESFSLQPEKKQYLLCSDYFLDLVRSIVAVYVNIDLLEEGMPDSGVEGLYDTVKEGKWTYDALCEYAERLQKRTEGAAQDELSGLVIQINLTSTGTSTAAESMVFCTDLQIVEYADGAYTYPETNDKADALVNKALQLYNTPGVRVLTSGTEADKTVFVNREAVFLLSYQIAQFETEDIRNMEAVSVVPLPKLEEGDEYVTQVHYGANLGAISIATQKFPEVTAFLQAMSTSSSEIVREYCEVALKFKYTSDPGTGAMLDILYSNMMNDKGNGKIIENYISQEINVPASYITQIVEDAYQTKSSSFTTKHSSTVEAKRTLLEQTNRNFKRLP